MDVDASAVLLLLLPEEIETFHPVMLLAAKTSVYAEASLLSAAKKLLLLEILNRSIISADTVCSVTATTAVFCNSYRCILQCVIARWNCG